jgi:Domain of unknown function (DUF4386)
MHRQVAARVAGTLFVIADVAGVGGKVLLSHQHDPDYFARAAEYSSSIVTGAVLVFVMALAVAMIAVVLFPVLKKQNEALALGYAVLRSIEALLYSVFAVAPLLLLTLSRQYAQAVTPDRSGLQPVADTLAKDDYWVGPFSQIAWSLSVVVLLFLLYRSNAVPRFISVWGLVGAPLYVANQLLILYNAPSLFSTLGAVVDAQFALNELVLVIWLLVKGFRPTPRLAPEPATTV